MGFLKGRKLRKVKNVERYDGPGPQAKDKDYPAAHPRDKDGKPIRGGEYFNVYEYEDGSCKTIEFSRTGAHLAEYEGEPQFPEDVEPPKPLSEGQPPKSVPLPPTPPPLHKEVAGKK